MPNNPDLGIFLDDRLGRDGCTCTPECRYIVSLFRSANGRYRRLNRIFTVCTPSEYLAFPAQVVDNRLNAMAVLDLEDYPDFTAVMEAAKDTSEKRGRTNREVARASRLGYYVKPFAYRQFLPDIVAIHHSKTERQGRELRGPLYAKTVDELGGAPTAPVEIPPLECIQHNWQYWGVFQKVEGYRQGAVEVGEQLVAYIRLRRQGISAAHTLIMGHGDHLRHGVMYLLHYTIVERLMQLRQPERPRYLVYLHYKAGEGAGDGVSIWKHRALFKPRYLHNVEERKVDLPPEPPMPGLGEGLLALKSTIFAPWPQAVQVGKELGVGPRWLRSLHLMWVIEQTHARSLTARVLREGPNPSLDALRPLSSGLFPRELLPGIQRAAAVLHDHSRGLDTLLPLFDAGIREAVVFHPDPEALAVLEGMYGGSWAFRPLTDACAEVGGQGENGADLLIIDCPDLAFMKAHLKRLVGAFRGRLLLSIGEEIFAWFGYDVMRISALYKMYGDDPAVVAESLVKQLSMLLDRPVRYGDAYYRHGDSENVFWISVTLE